MVYVDTGAATSFFGRESGNSIAEAQKLDAKVYDGTKTSIFNKKGESFYPLILKNSVGSFE
jgi:hypothetical protein